MCRSGQGNRQAGRRRGGRDNSKSAAHCAIRHGQARSRRPEAQRRAGGRLAQGAELAAEGHGDHECLAGCPGVLPDARGASRVRSNPIQPSRPHPKAARLLVTRRRHVASIARRTSDCIGTAQKQAAPPLGIQQSVAPRRPAGRGNGGRSIQSGPCRVGRTIRPWKPGPNR